MQAQRRVFQPGHGLRVQVAARLQQGRQLGQFLADGRVGGQALRKLLRPGGLALATVDLVGQHLHLGAQR